MFGSGPTREQFDALSDLVMAHQDVIEVSRECNDANAELILQLGEFASQMRAEALIIKGMLGAIIAEIAARRENPHDELQNILARIRFTANEFTIDMDEMADHAANARDFVCEYAEDYILRGSDGPSQ